MQIMPINYNEPQRPGHQAEYRELDLIPGHQAISSFSETSYYSVKEEPFDDLNIKMDQNPNKNKRGKLAPAASFKLYYLGECKQNIPPHTQEMEANILKNKYPDDVDTSHEFLTKKTDKQCPDAANHFSEEDHLRERGNPTVLNPYIYIYIYISP